jgi:hypothetical protein
MAQTAAGQHEAESVGLVAATAAAVELAGATELGADHDEGFVEETFFLEIGNQRGERGVELADENVLVELAGVVGVPTGAVDKIQIVRDLDEADAGLHQAAREEAALAKLAAVALARRGGLLAELEVPHEAGTGETQGLALDLGAIGERDIAGRTLLQRREEALARFGPREVDAIGRRETGGARLGVDEVDVAVFRPEEARAAAHARVTDQQIRGQIAAHGAALVGDDGAERRIDRAAAHGPAGVDEIRGERVLDAELVVHGAHGGDVLGEAGRLREVLGVTHTGHGGVDNVVIGAGHGRLGLGVAAFLGIEGVDLRHAAAEPDEDAVFGFAARGGNDLGGTADAGQRRGGGERGGLSKKSATIHGARGDWECGGNVGRDALLQRM